MHKIDRLVNKEKVFYISEWVTVKTNVSKGEVYLEMSVYKTSKQNKILFMRVVQFFLRQGVVTASWVIQADILLESQLGDESKYRLIKVFCETAKGKLVYSIEVFCNYEGIMSISWNIIVVDISAMTFYNFENMMKKIKTINNIRQKEVNKHQWIWFRWNSFCRKYNVDLM